MAKKEILNNDVVTLRVGETAADILEQAVEETEKALDIIESIPEKVITVTKNNPFVLVGVLLTGVAIGGFVSYKITQKRLIAQYDEELSRQIEATKAYHRRVTKTGEFESPESTVQALNVPDKVGDVVREYQGRSERVPYDKPDEVVDPRPPIETVVEEVHVTHNVFVQAEKNNQNDPRDWDYNAEIADRELHPDQPYTISFEEFNENPEHNEQTTVTYYVQDNTLVDAQDKPIDNVAATVGEDNLTRFGHGSHDPNVVYVRNEKISMDFEVVRDHGSYSKAVFGTEPEQSLQHSRRRPNRRSWREDE